jgi:ATP-binding cassette, subfamily C, bacterial CydC
MSDVLRILELWRSRIIWLTAGVIFSVAALLAGVGMMVLGGTMAALSITTGVLVATSALRVFGIARVVLRYFERLVTHDATFRALADLRVWFFRGIAHSAAGGLGFRQAGDVLTRLVADIESLDGIYLRILVPLAGAVLLLPIIVAELGVHDVALAVCACILFAVAAFIVPSIGARTAAKTGAALAKATGALRIAALDALTGLREVRAFGAEGRMLAFVQAREAALLSAQRELAGKSSLANAAALLCGQVAILAVLIAAGADPVPAVAAMFLMVAAFEAVGGMPGAGILAGHAAAASRRVLEAAQAPVPVPDPMHPAALPAGFALRFDAVHFRWLADRPPVFDGLCLEVPQGARVALLGASGAGKSTLAALALKVAAPQQGSVLLGDIDVASLPAADVRRRIAWLSQATHLFDDTIRANLLLARPDADANALWAALDAARIGEMVRALPDGLDTWVGEGGARFSGGQGRRLALARALLSPAPILILDEPCAGLDAETERAFLATLNEVAQGRSVILITHRLMGVERLDRIWRLSGGRAVAAAA